MNRETALTFVIIAIVAVIVGYIFYLVISDIIYRINHFLPVHTNCSDYDSRPGTGSIGSENGPVCPEGQLGFEGVCYEDTWTANGGVKTLECTVYYGPYGGVRTKLNNADLYALNYGESCETIPGFTVGWFKTAEYTCQYRGAISADLYCIRTGIPRICKPGWDYFEAICYYGSCPAGTYRTAACSCQNT